MTKGPSKRIERNSIPLAKRLREAEVHSELEIYPGQPHASPSFEPDRTVTTRRVERFLVERFGLKG